MCHPFIAAEIANANLSQLSPAGYTYSGTALDQAAPLVGWELPECFVRLRRLLEARLNKGGKREYVQVLRLLETFSIQEVEGPSSMRCIWARLASTPSS